MPIVRHGYYSTAPRRNGSTRAHRQARALTLLQETTCWLCGLPPTPSDPFEADHIIPHSLGGATARDNYHAAHRSCNRIRGAGSI